jgi:heme/copper-type cytochrome/quinol oxidase subunit 2
MLDCIKQSSELITLIFSAVVMVSTVVYAILTWNLVKCRFRTIPSHNFD